MPNNTQSPWLTVAEASKVMRLGINTVYRLCNEGSLPCRKVGRTIHIRRQDAENWLGENEPTVSYIGTRRVS